MSDEDVRQFLETEIADLPVGSAEDPLNFVDEVVIVLNRWTTTFNQEIGLEKPAYCCFVNCDRVRQIVETHEGFSHKQYFRDDTPQDFLGKIYLCSPTLQSVFARPVVASSIDDLTKEIAALGLSAQAIIVFNAASKQAFWRSGTGTDLVPIQLDGGIAQLNSADFDEELKRFYIEYTATPQGWVKPWKNAKKRLTKDHLEHEIRDYLCIFLKLKHKKWVLVTRESYEPTGRADLKIYFILERISFFIELKVFRISDSDTVELGKHGIAQAHAYRIANDESGVAYACCYDARATNSDFQELKDYADSMNVRYRRYFVYQSTGDFQRSFIH
jgi:hypothetical protein